MALCMSAILLSLITYGRFQEEKVYEIVDYILAHRLNDGGWNCAWNSTHDKSDKSSLHTTISVLEAFHDYQLSDYTYRLDEIKEASLSGQEILLKRELFKKSNGEKIHHDMILFHYPTRWKYDCFRALEYFVSVDKSYDNRMNAALILLQKQIKKGYILTGKQYPGELHFKLEDGRKGRFNTFRALKILQKYDISLYNNLVNFDFTNLD